MTESQTENAQTREASSAPPEPDNLESAFSPASVAVVGATEDQSKFGGRLMARLIGEGFRGEIWPVNPRRSSVMGLPSYPSLADLPGAPEHVGIVLPAPLVMNSLTEAHQVGARIATVFSGGFAELGSADGKNGQQEIRDFADRTGLRVIGPNCNGLINLAENFALTTTATLDWPNPSGGGLAVVSQSGGLGQVNVMWRAQRAGIGVSHQISSGNDADLGALDYSRYLIRQPQTKCLALVLESIRSGSEFASLALDAAERDVPILLLKIGRSEAGAQAALSHTGAITGADDVVEAACREYGVIRVSDADELVDVAQLFTMSQRVKGRRLGSVTVSGGNNALLSDLAGSTSLSFPQLSPPTEARLSNLLPDYAQVANPLDLTTAGINDPSLAHDALMAITPEVDTAVSILTHIPASSRESLREITNSIDRPHVALWVGGALNGELTPADLVSDGMAVFASPSRMLRALEIAASHHAFLHSGAAERLRSKLRQAPARARPPASDLAQEAELLGELSRAGIPLPRWRVVDSVEAARDAAVELGYPLALKISSEKVPHKTDLGLVHLGVSDLASVEQSYSQLTSAFSARWPDASANVLVQQMAASGVELLVGGKTDPVFGPVVIVGMGGVLAEVLRDRTMRLAPVSEEQALEMLGELRGASLLAGVRGARPADTRAAARTIAMFSEWFFARSDDLQEADLNPVVVHPQGEGVSVLDALAIGRGAE